MKKLVVPFLLGFAALASMPTSAQVSGDFDVNVTLNSACELSTAPSAINLVYTSFAAAQVTGDTSFSVRCTDGLAYTLALDSTNADQLGLTVGLAIRNAGDTADATGGTQSGSAATSYRVKATIAAGQQGTCATASCSASVTRTLTVSY